MNVLVTGGTGLIGKHLQEVMPDAVYVGSKDYDLTSQKQVSSLIRQEKPQWVIHLAAKVGGIIDNQSFPCDYYEDNILMNTNLIAACRNHGIKRFTGILSTCCYPDVVSVYPMDESFFFSGQPSASNFAYAMAKRAMATHIDTINQQYGLNYNYLIPCNLYGKYDKYNPKNSHYVGALIKKIAESDQFIELYGSGSPLRQFMYAGDMAMVIKQMIDQDITESFNVATPENYTINRIAEIALESIGKKLEIKYDNSFPDGQFRKDVSADKFLKYFPEFEFTKLSEGIKIAYDYYLQNNL